MPGRKVLWGVGLCAAVWFALLPSAEAGRRRGRDTVLKSRMAEATEAERKKYNQAEALFRAGLSHFEKVEYELALKYFERAVQMYPNHEQATKYLLETRDLLGVPMDKAARTIARLADAEKIKIEQTMAEIESSYKRASRFYGDASRFHRGDESRSPDYILSRQIRDLEKAITECDRVVEVTRWMPHQYNVEGIRRKAESLRETAIKDREGKVENLRDRRRKVALSKTGEFEAKETKYFRAQLREMMQHADRYFRKQEFERCEQMCRQILKLDPQYFRAKSMLKRARQKKHDVREADIYHKTRYYDKSASLVVEEATIPYARRIIYPDNWEQIVARAEKVGIGIGGTEEKAWAKDIRRSLDKKVSFEFVDTPLTEAVSFLQQLTDVNIVLDPKAIEDGDIPINLKVTNMSTELALSWILRLAELDFELRDDAIFISRPEELKGDVYLKIYDIRDLTEAIPNFPGPELRLQTQQTAGFGGMGGGLGGISVMAEEEEVTASSLAEMISTRVRPESWGQEYGTSIEERGGKLVVMQRPEVHKLINKLLASFRATQKLLVTVEARFLEITQSFYEEIGFDWGGLPGQGGWGPDVPPPTAPTPLNTPFGRNRIVQDNIPAGFDAHIVSDMLWDAAAGAPLQIEAGLIGDPTSLNWGGGGNESMHLLGASHLGGKNLTSPESTTLGREWDPAGGPLAQGLNAQLLHLGQLEAQLFLHALKIRQHNVVLHAPRLTVYNTQRAHMFVAQQRSYIADYEISGENYDPVIRQFLQGVVFDVKPTVSSDRRYITLEMRPTTAYLDGQLEETTIQALVTIPTGGGDYVTVVQFLPIFFPKMIVRKVRTTVTLPDGGIILLGGMVKDVKFHSEVSVPFISNIPIIGKLFRWDTTDNEKINLSVLATAKVLIFEEEEKKL